MIHALLMETKVSFKKYVRSEGRCYQAKSVLARLGGRGGSTVSARTPQFFSQVRCKIEIK